MLPRTKNGKIVVVFNTLLSITQYVFAVWFKISITHFLNSSQKPFIAFYNVTQKCAFTNAKSINVLSDIDFKCQRKHPIILFWWNMSINWCMNYFSDTPNPETQLSKDGSGAGFKVGKVKLHFEVHGLAFSIISCCPQQARATLWLFSLDPSEPEHLHWGCSDFGHIGVQWAARWYNCSTAPIRCQVTRLKKVTRWKKQ